MDACGTNRGVTRGSPEPRLPTLPLLPLTSLVGRAVDRMGLPREEGQPIGEEIGEADET